MMRTQSVMLLLSFSLAAHAFEEHIKVDQFGYLPHAPKVAVISNPQKGYDAGDKYHPGDTLSVREVNGGKVFTGTAISWRDGKVDTWSGDQVWWFDFSAVTTPGEYYVYDDDNETRSANFVIGDGVYKEVLRQAMRTFFYQRINFAKQLPYAEKSWVDGASHGGPEQDYDVRAMNHNNPAVSDPATGMDLSGGWYDAGDLNKYITYADGTLHDLLLAYEENPGAWGDDFGIPESGNGIPDILDEIKYELDWMFKMQLKDGSVLHKVASITWDATTPPSSDTIPRRYAEATASATISLAGAFSHAALVFGAQSDASLQAYAAQLRTAAEKAWDWLEANPDMQPSRFKNNGFVNVSAEDEPLTQRNNHLVAALYLYILTEKARYKTHITERVEKGILLLRRKYLNFDGGEQELQDALLYYAKTYPQDELSIEIKAVYEEAMYTPWVDFAPVRQYQERGDAYRSYMDYYSWGSNRAKAAAGLTLTNMLLYGLSSPNDAIAQTYLDAALGYLHYIHGVNPFSLVFLTNMSRFGAEKSINEMYHLWFRHDSQWDNVQDSSGPPPGYLVGGAMEEYEESKVYVDGVAQTSHLVKNQPILKSFAFDNSVKASYKLLENSITYQAAYVRLLSKFVPSGNNPPSAPSVILTTNGNKITLQWFALGANEYVLYYAPYPDAQPIYALPLGGGNELSVELPAKSKFFYAIQGLNSMGPGPYSSISELLLP